jgi:hypothetical protein
MTTWIYDRPPTSQDGNYVGDVMIRNTQEQEQVTGQLCAYCNWKDVAIGIPWRHAGLRMLDPKWSHAHESR